MSTVVARCSVSLHKDVSRWTYHHRWRIMLILFIHWTVFHHIDIPVGKQHHCWVQSIYLIFMLVCKSHSIREVNLYISHWIRKWYRLIFWLSTINLFNLFHICVSLLFPWHMCSLPVISQLHTRFGLLIRIVRFYRFHWTIMILKLFLSIHYRCWAEFIY